MKVVKQLLVVAFFLVLLAIANWAHRKIMSSDANHVAPEHGQHETETARVGSNGTMATRTNDAATPTFADVAPIIHSRCSHCHYDGGSAPFSLITYKDVAKRSGQIAEVTQSHYMPPWLPGKSDYAFANDRSLTDEELATLKRWFETGMSDGTDASRQTWTAPSTGWQLGEPDLVLTLKEPYSLSATGPEVFWNFVLPANMAKSEFVEATEIKPGNMRAVHHIVGLVDRTGDSRRRQDATGENGFPGMEVHAAEILPGQSMLWSPGRRATAPTQGIAWPLGPRTDIVLQMHMFPSGKEEVVQPQVGLYFADSPPTLHPLSIMLEAPTIDIPAGETDYAVTDEILLPVDVKLLSLYPHAHYIGSTVECIATLPDQTKRTLLKIGAWDFNWQDEYQFKQPIDLPHGTLITMRFTYDNSAENVRNPNTPPKRVVLGSKTTDEMGSLLLQVLVANEREHAALDESRWEQKLLTSPLHPTANQNLGNIYEARGDLQKALKHYRRVLQVSSDSSVAHDNVASVLSALGEVVTADKHFRSSVDANPKNAMAFNHWGAALMRQGRLEEAAERLKKAISIWPEFPEASANFGELELLRGDTEKAKEHFRSAIKHSPTYALAHFNLGTVLMGEQSFAAASEAFKEAIKLNGRFAGAHNNLGICLFQQGKLEASATAFRRSVELDPNYINPQQNLETVEKELRERGGK